MDDLKIEYVPIDQLKPFAGNPRTHPEAAIEKLVASIERFGWTNPVLVDSGGRVLAGHARLKAAKKAGIEQVPVVRLPLAGKDAELYVIADNKTQELTEWDWSKLGDLFGELDTGDIDLTLSGFDTKEIEGLMCGLDLSSGNKSEEEWKGMPEYEHNDLRPDSQIIISFACETDRKQFAKLIGQAISPKTRSVWYPKQEWANMHDKEYRD